MAHRQLKLENLYKHYAAPLYYYLLRLGGSIQHAEDLTQETFVRATIHLHTFEGDEARAWLFKVARHTYIDEWRKRQRRQSLPFLSRLMRKEEMVSPYGVPDESLLMKEQHEELVELLQYLPENYRSILYLRAFEAFSYRELMDTLQLTESQVKVTLHRARRRLSELAKQKGWQYDGME